MIGFQINPNPVVIKKKGKQQQQPDDGGYEPYTDEQQEMALLIEKNRLLTEGFRKIIQLMESHSQSVYNRRSPFITGTSCTAVQLLNRLYTKVFEPL